MTALLAEGEGRGSLSAGGSDGASWAPVLRGTNLEGNRGARCSIAVAEGLRWQGDISISHSPIRTGPWGGRGPEAPDIC